MQAFNAARKGMEMARRGERGKPKERSSTLFKVPRAAVGQERNGVPHHPFHHMRLLWKKGSDAFHEQSCFKTRKEVGRGDTGSDIEY